MNFHFNRKVWQILWEAIMPEKFQHFIDDYENEVFCIHSYDWSDEDNNEWHFWHKPSGFKMYWYKYPLRSGECNMEISDAQFVDILNDCHNSMQHEKRVKLLFDVDKWWYNE